MATILSRMARLGDPDAPFRFQKGDRVAWTRFDGSPDSRHAGVVVDAICAFQPGTYRGVYLVQRNDGSYFGADAGCLVRLSTPP